MPWWRNGFGYDISFILAVIALVGASLISFGIAERCYSIRYMTPAPSAAGDEDGVRRRAGHAGQG